MVKSLIKENFKCSHGRVTNLIKESEEELKEEELKLNKNKRVNISFFVLIVSPSPNTHKMTCKPHIRKKEKNIQT